MKLLIILLILDRFIDLGNLYFFEINSTNNEKVSNDGDNFDYDLTRRKIKRSSINSVFNNDRDGNRTHFFKNIQRIFNNSANTKNVFSKVSIKSETLCHLLTCPSYSKNALYPFYFNCKCRNNWRNPYNDKKCIDWWWVCDGIVDCDDGEDETDCHCSDDQFQCNPCSTPTQCGAFETLEVFNPYKCIPLNQVNDGIYQCSNRRDEISESDIFTQKCINGLLKCNGYINYPNLNPHDEFNCSGCTSQNEIACDCYKQKERCKGKGRVCYLKTWKCDGVVSCIDGSDELDCSCGKEEFQCSCYKADPIKCEAIYGKSYKQCIPLSKYHDGRKDCMDGSDETTHKNIVSCENNDLVLRRLTNREKCAEVFYFGSVTEQFSTTFCDNSTCHKVSSLNCSGNRCNTTDIICASLEQPFNNSTLCRNPFQCDDGSLLLTNNFCDEKYDCPDLSDEILSGPGFKCSGVLGYCVLPQRNLYDRIPQCKDNLDLNCPEECFICLDNRLLISLKQVCDGVFDCYDLSDECLCQVNVGNTLCNSVFPKNNSTMNSCCHVTNISEKIIQATQSSKHFCWSRSKLSSLVTPATLCDYKSECADLSDECNCENPPPFCNDSCHNFYTMGDRYCDGIADQSWKLINKSICPEGFDETNCRNRFMCKAGNYVSIDIFKKCDGVTDCDEGEDEKDCNRKALFSSKKEMIANTSLKTFCWIMGFAVIGGNIYVIIASVLYFKKTKDKKGVKLYHLIVLNISIADIIMGFYLLIISAYSVIFSGYYGKVDHAWRSSLLCSIVGSLTILSSEASCLLMVLLSSFRLKQIVKPFKSLTMWAKPWKAGIALAWSISAMFAFLPLFHHYFVKEIWFANEFMRSSTTWDKTNITNFACRLAQLTNKTIKSNGKNWEFTKIFLKNNFPKYAPKGEFGYFAETSVCMPRFYVALGDKSWEFTLILITLNCIAFIYIAISYLVLYKRASKQLNAIQNKVRAKRDKIMQNRIARIILTDFLCWIPICITFYVKLAGHGVPNEFYIYSAVLLLPINSALNPFLFSPIIEKIIQKIQSCRNVHAEKPKNETSIRYNHDLFDNKKHFASI